MPQAAQLHPGEAAVRMRAGVRGVERALERIGPDVPPVAADFLRKQQLMVVSARGLMDELWVGVLAGEEGFVQIPETRLLEVAAAPSAYDPLAGAFHKLGPIGMIGLDPRTQRRIRINGDAVRSPNGLTITTRQVLANCPKYVQLRDRVEPNSPRRPIGAVHRRGLTPKQQEWINSADTFFLGTSAALHGADASHRGGNPGFVQAISGRHIAWPDYVGNGMFMSLGNLHLNPACALLFLDWESGHTLHITGRAQVDWSEQRATGPSAHRFIDFAVEAVIEVRNHLSARWKLRQRSRFNPPVG
jgi:predicted pyridoxine 5'-phosphate oxidase superfamily flavin-nucleotide-binding protein